MSSATDFFGKKSFANATLNNQMLQVMAMHWVTVNPHAKYFNFSHGQYKMLSYDLSEFNWLTISAGENDLCRLL